MTGTRSEIVDEAKNLAYFYTADGYIVNVEFILNHSDDINTEDAATEKEIFALIDETAGQMMEEDPDRWAFIHGPSRTDRDVNVSEGSVNNDSDVYHEYMRPNPLRTILWRTGQQVPTDM